MRPPAFPRGFRCAARLVGIQEGGEGPGPLRLGPPPAPRRGSFTRNRFPRAPHRPPPPPPAVVGRERLRDGRLQAVGVNSKVSNVATGEERDRPGPPDGTAAAAELGIDPEPGAHELHRGTAAPLPIELIEAGSRDVGENSREDPLWEPGDHDHRHPSQALSVGVGERVINHGGKASGMIEPNMATMLALPLHRRRDRRRHLDGMLRRAVQCEPEHALGGHGHQHLRHLRPYVQWEPPSRGSGGPSRRRWWLSAHG